MEKDRSECRRDSKLRDAAPGRQVLVRRLGKRQFGYGRGFVIGFCNVVGIV